MLQLTPTPALPAIGGPLSEAPRSAASDAVEAGETAFVLDAPVEAGQLPDGNAEALVAATQGDAPAELLLPAGEQVRELPVDEVEALLGSLLAQRDTQVQARGESVQDEAAGAAAALLATVQAAVLGLSPAGSRSPLRAGQDNGAFDLAPAAGREPVEASAAVRSQAMPAAVALPDSAARQLADLATGAESAPGDAVAPVLDVAASEGSPARPQADTALRADPASALSRPAALEQRLQLQGPEAKWGEQMLNALRDSVELQLKQNKQQATIRLDPAELGSLEIRLNQEGGRLQIHINAAQGDVARLLQQTSERLRQDLIGQHFVQVDVQVGADSQSGQRQAREGASLFAEEAPRAALDEQADGERGAQGVRSDVLVSV
ncbi:putative Flagellar hook-length control protein [Pseudomonas sp. 8AS]|uniref:flagellar hook-length control protein FliK n=1 Tax=Pseudomonas sp. 8AS TaxID=2653163 RepID=UPI0012EF8224|nr:flagellar hook-length control protein FliK [Pseudomonas sp. 8AS]VXC27388.1 putative Flagellar hook-length control protein [Pseudomonas sp. 8AS]